MGERANDGSAHLKHFVSIQQIGGLLAQLKGKYVGAPEQDCRFAGEGDSGSIRIKVGIQVEPGNIKSSSEARKKIRALYALEILECFLRLLVPISFDEGTREFPVVVACAPGKDKNALANRMRGAAIHELRVLHWGQEVTQPSEGHTLQSGIEFVKEDQRYLPSQNHIADEMKGCGEFIRFLILRQIECQVFNSPRPASLQSFCDHLDPKGFPSTRGAKNCNTERAGRGSLTDIVEHQAVQCPVTLDFTAIVGAKRACEDCNRYLVQ